MPNVRILVTTIDRPGKAIKGDILEVFDPWQNWRTDGVGDGLFLHNGFMVVELTDVPGENPAEATARVKRYETKLGDGVEIKPIDGARRGKRRFRCTAKAGEGLESLDFLSRRETHSHLMAKGVDIVRETATEIDFDEEENMPHDVACEDLWLRMNRPRFRLAPAWIDAQIEGQSGYLQVRVGWQNFVNNRVRDKFLRDD